MGRLVAVLRVLLKRVKLIAVQRRRVEPKVFETIGAARLREWLPYRIDREQFAPVLRALAPAGRRKER